MIRTDDAFIRFFENWKHIDMSDDDEDDSIYDVVMNHEQQYSIWIAGRELPAGWKTVEKRGSKRECLDHIELVWTDMRPLSLRKRMDEQRTIRSNAA